MPETASYAQIKSANWRVQAAAFIRAYFFVLYVLLCLSAPDLS